MNTPLPEAATYLNTAATGLIDESVRAAGEALMAGLATTGSVRAEQWRSEEEPAIRETVAAFLGAAPSQVALLPNFSWGLNAVVQSMEGTERILMYCADYPSLTEPFRINGFPIHWVDTRDGFSLPLEEIESCIRNNSVDIVALSHVQYNSGYVLPILEIGALCKAHGVRLIIDATQSLGALPLNLKKQYADVLITSNYKWMNAGFGTGVMYVSDDFLKAYTPVVCGFHSFVMHSGTHRYEASARSYEPGHTNLYGLSILKEAILQKQAKGVRRIAEQNRQLTAAVLDGIRDLPLQLIGPNTMDHRSSMILLRDIGGLSERLRRSGIIVTARGGLVRISMHYYNTQPDVDKLLECLRSSA